MSFMDQHLLFLINQQWTNPVLDRALATLACLDFWIPLLVLAGLWMIFRKNVRGILFILLCLTGVAINEGLVSSPLKRWTNKRRPHEALENVRRVDLAQATPRLLAITLPVNVSRSGPPPERVDRGRSFPSSHVLNAATLGIMAAFLWQRRVLLVLPILMAWARVYMGVHWPSDVAASIAMGLVLNLALLWYSDKLWRRWAPRLHPDWHQKLPSLFPNFQKSPPATAS